MYGLAVMEWMKADGCLWQPDESWCAIAGMSGDVLLLQWLRGNSVPWDYKTVLNAAESGHITSDIHPFMAIGIAPPQHVLSLIHI